MTRRWALGGGIALLLLVAATLAITSTPGAESSALSAAPRGLLVARRYLEERGTPSLLLDSPFTEAKAMPAVLVVAFPWQRFSPGEDLGAVGSLLHHGTTLVYGFSGERFSPPEEAFVDALGLDWVSPRGDPPLHPARWRSFVDEVWTLAFAGSSRVLRVEMRATARIPRPPAHATVHFRGPGQTPVIFSYRVGRGQVIVLPAEALSNAFLPHADNLSLLEGLRERPGPWTFDEYHHGLSAPTAAVAGGSVWVLDLYLLQLVLLYGLALLALARRFGPAWSDPPVVTGSAGAFLRGLGGLHHRLGHHGEATRLLLARARELHPHLTTPPPFGGGERGLVALAQALSRQQRLPRRNR